MINIDGSQGEGGGQIIRSALALAAVTGKPFTVYNVRAGRKKPGLKRQHVTCVKAARDICGAQVEGDVLQSSKLVFVPGEIKPGEYRFSIGTAGSSSLVAQTVLPALMMAQAPSKVTVEGGTHNEFAPPYDFLERVYLRQVTKMGPQFAINIETYGFYPVGGGKFSVSITPASELRGLEIMNRDSKTKAGIHALVANLPLHIAEREVDVLRRKGNWSQSQCFARSVESPGPGNVVMLELDSQNVNEIVTGFGRRGVKAEQVARAVYRQARDYLESDIPVGEYLADQLLLPTGFAASKGHTSRFVTGPLSLHSTTHIEILKLFLDIEIEVTELDEKSFEICVSPTAAAGQEE